MFNQLVIGGLGPEGIGGISHNILSLIEEYQGEGCKVILRTALHPAAKELMDRGLHFISCDRFYEEGDSFEQVYNSIAAFVIDEAVNSKLLYLVPGHPMVAERTVTKLLELNPDAMVLSAQSFLDPLFSLLKIDPLDKGFTLVDACSLEEEFKINMPVVFTQVYDRFIASDLKLFLEDKLDEDIPVIIVWHAGINKEEKLVTLPLKELDHFKDFDHLTSVYLDPQDFIEPHIRLEKIFKKLLGPEGCPWDKAQTHDSLKKYLLEEANEVCEAIDNEDMDNLCEELGDVVLQVFLHSFKAKEEGFFNLDQVYAGLAEKLIRRHPHVFGDKKCNTPDEVARLWQEIKEKERKNL